LKSFINKVYSKSPVFIQDFVITTYGLLLKKQRYGQTYHEMFSFYKNKDSGNLVTEIELQNTKLKEFVKFAYSKSKYYQQLYKNINIDTISCVDDLVNLPIVTKEDLRANIKDVYTLSPKDAIKSFTGGTTGKALEVLFTQDDFQERMAYLDVFKSKLGVDPFLSKKATFSGRELITDSKTTSQVFWRNNKAYNQRLYSTFHISDKNLPYYVTNLQEFKPDVINGFVSAIYEVAKFIEKENTKLYFKPKAIFTTSETLLSFHREVIERVFQCKIFNQYASAEGAPFITECSQGELHYNIDTGIIEQIDGGDSILVTSFTTHGTPLIRYDIGDQVKFKEGECSCGSSHPLVEEVKGRMVDYLESPDGNKVSLSHLADVIKGMPSCIKKVQFIQREINLINLKMVVDKSQYIEKYNKLIIDSMLYRFGKNTKFILEQVDDIPREKSGKYSLIKNEYLKNNRTVK
jgi:phenylacetate-CoA ligase